MKSETKDWLRKYGLGVVWLPLSIFYILWGHQIVTTTYPRPELWLFCFGIAIFCVGVTVLFLITFKAVCWLAKVILTDFVEEIIDKKSKSKP